MQWGDVRITESLPIFTNLIDSNYTFTEKSDQLFVRFNYHAQIIKNILQIYSLVLSSITASKKYLKIS